MNNDSKKVFDSNLTTAAIGFIFANMQGFKPKKLAPTKENLKKFQEQFTGHPLCGCFSCMELAKNFILENHSIKEEVISESMRELDSK
jgi:hypothetical protein